MSDDDKLLFDAIFAGFVEGFDLFRPGHVVYVCVESSKSARINTTTFSPTPARLHSSRAYSDCVYLLNCDKEVLSKCCL